MPGDVYVAKAEGGLAGAVSECDTGRFNNCANRCYYTAFQAGIAALRRAGIGPSAADAKWNHGGVQEVLAQQLINRRKLYPAAYRNVLGRLFALRATADYSHDRVSRTQAERALSRTRDFVHAVQSRGA